MEVRKIMTKNPACATPDSNLTEVAHMMEMYDCGCIPVVDNHITNQPIGTITDRDIVIRTVAVDKNPLELKASDVMTTDIVTVKPETHVQECLNIMEKKQIRRILVIDKSGRVTGIVAQADLAEHAAQAGQTAHFLREVSETDSQHKNGENFSSQKDSQQSTRRGIYSETTAETYSKPEKSSFFNTTTLLTLLASVGIGAGVKYYLDSNESGGKNKVKKTKSFKGSNIKTHPVEAPDLKIETPDMKINESPAGFTTGNATISRNANPEATSGVDTSFKNSGTNDDDDLKPILELGRTANNS